MKLRPPFPQVRALRRERPGRVRALSARDAPARERHALRRAAPARADAAPVGVRRARKPGRGARARARARPDARRARRGRRERRAAARELRERARRLVLPRRGPVPHARPLEVLQGARAERRRARAAARRAQLPDGRGRGELPAHAVPRVRAVRARRHPCRRVELPLGESDARRAEAAPDGAVVGQGCALVVGGVACLLLLAGEGREPRLAARGHEDFGLLEDAHVLDDLVVHAEPLADDLERVVLVALAVDPAAHHDARAPLAHLLELQRPKGVVGAVIRLGGTEVPTALAAKRAALLHVEGGRAGKPQTHPRIV